MKAHDKKKEMAKKMASKEPHMNRMRSMGFPEKKVQESAKNYKTDYQVNKESEAYENRKRK